MRFDPTAALDHARALARPRRVGTAANDAVISGLADHLRSAGCAVDVVPFEFSSAGERAIVVFVLIAQILILLVFWTWGFNAWAAVVPAALLVALLLSTGQIYRAAARASLWPRNPSQAPRLRRWWLGRVWLPWLTTPAAVAGLVALVSSVPLLFLLLAGSGNASPGAIDNAAGAGLVLHLAECLCANPPARPVTVLITGAEELGLLGSLAFVHSANPQALSGAHVLNFDGIGTAGRLALVGGAGRALQQTGLAACRDLAIS